ncbi:MAG: endolytic transglycosylase MltG [Gammaproteobacteria bacterium]|nr:endolytic transglycosylase MltG [Gammaproteobacteria bacterium]
MLQKFFGLLFLTASIFLGWLMLDFNHFIDTPLQIPEGGEVYDLKAGSTISSVAAGMHQRGYLKQPWYLRLIARWDGTANQIKAGEYHLSHGLKPRDLVDVLISGKVVSYSLTLVEGWDFKQSLQAIRQQPALKQTLEGKNPEQIMEMLGYPDQHPEGHFLPDTYQFPRGTTDLAFLKRAYIAMQHLLEKEWPNRQPGLPLNSPYDALILASIVEKETGVARERPVIAGVFTRRLHKGMKLQTDPTVIYAMGEEYKGNIRRRDLKRDSPYNTYFYKGLTPTPISMPGADAIRAVLHPAEGSALYFVSKGDGSHYFSATLKEHNRAVRKYQLKK